MESFDTSYNTESLQVDRRGSAELREWCEMKEKEAKRKRNIGLIAVFLILLFLLRLMERPEQNLMRARYEQERMAEEAIAQQLMQAMMEQQQQEEQYRLVPSEMVPGLPPGGLVKVRVRADHGEHMGGMPMDGAGQAQGIPLPGGRMLVVRGAPMHDPDAFRSQMPVQDSNAEAHMQMAALMAQGIPQPIAAQMVLATMADGAGDHGHTGGMERTETPEELSLQVHLPGHHVLDHKDTFDADESSKDREGNEQLNPLDIKLLDRTVLIRGTMRKEAPWMGDGVFVTSSFQRALWLPANAIKEKIQCDYGRKSGNLVIKIPKDPSKPEKDEADEDHPVEDQQRVEKIRRSFQAFQERVRAMQANEQEGVRGPGAVHGVQYDDLKARLEQMHDDGTGVKIEDSSPHMAAISRDSVEYLGCFSSWDLPRHKKQLPAHAASSFAKCAISAIKDAQEDTSANLEDEEDQYFFAMARHDAPHKTGAAFTFRRFDHEINNRHGVMCGSHCDDDGTWFCGALGDEEHHSEKTEEDGVEGAQFAVYALRKPKEISAAAFDAAAAADHDAENAEHPTWKLVDNFDGGVSKVEIIVPKDSNFCDFKQNDARPGGVATFFKSEGGEQTVSVVLPMNIFPGNFCEFGNVSDGVATRVVSCDVLNAGFQALKVNVKDEL